MRTMNHRGTFGVCARILLASLALLLCFFAADARAEADGMLRVKLARLGSPSAIQLRADCDYYLASDPAVRVPAGQEMTVFAEGGSLTLSAGKYSAALGESALLMRGQSGHRGAQFISPALSNRFCGDISFSASSGVVTTVLHIYVEDYLYGVVGYEIGPSSGLEALKAQAVVARNYALRQKAARTASAYDLSDSGDALSFRGYNAAPEYADSLRAVDETRGQVLYYGDSPATCYYCDSNGGQIESSANALGVALPYSEVRDDPYDYDGAGAKKTAALRKDCSDLNEALKRALIEGMAEQLVRLGLSADFADITLNAIENIAPGEARYPAPSRLYTALEFQLNITSVTADGSLQPGIVRVSVPTYGALEDWYELGINAEDNETIWISENERAFEITFRRSGSGVGMSQRGAQMMARKGLSCWDILEYYYPGVSLRQLELRSSEAGGAAQDAPSVEPIATARLSQKARLYERADDTGGALTTLPAGAIVDVYAVQGDWAALGSGGIYGFAHTDALTAFSLAGVTAARVKEQTFAQVSAGPVDALQLPVEGARIVATLSGGDTVRLNAYTDKWALITTQSEVEGFIPRDALTLQTPGAASDGEIVAVTEPMAALLTGEAGLYVNADDSVAPRRSLESGGYVDVLAYNRVWAYVRTSDGVTGFVKLDRLSAVQARPEAAEDGKVTRVEGEVYRVVSADALPMYETASADSPALAILEKGKRVQLGAYNDKWACVRADGLTGFVALSALAEDAPAAKQGEGIDGGAVTRVEGEQFAVVTEDGTALYAAWNTDSETLLTLHRGDTVRLGAYNAKWACVKAEGKTGFVLISALRLAEGAATEDDGVIYRELDAVTDGPLPMFSASDLSGEVLVVIGKGAQVHVYAFNDVSAYAEYEGQRGFVELKHLKQKQAKGN